jgi:hypothetical protein
MAQILFQMMMIAQHPLYYHRKRKIPTKALSRKLGPEVWAFLYGKNKPLLYLAVPTILTSTFFFFALNGFRPFHLCHSASQLGLGTSHHESN